MASPDIHLFSPLTLRSVQFRNRIAVSPMCQYSSEDGFPTDWHLVHLGSRAIGGAALVIAEACGVSPEGRITAQDLGIWKDEHITPLGRIAKFLAEYGAAPGLQIAHAGRKASTRPPWQGGTTVRPEEGGWLPVAPSAVPFHQGDPVPQELTREQIQRVIADFAAATRRAVEAGFRVLEIHAAHGYLLHEFFSPLINQRSDEYGGSFENRTRLVREVTRAVRSQWPDSLPLFVRISASDWVPGGWDIDQSVALARQLADLGADLIDCSSGGAVPRAKIPAEPGYQIPFAARIKKETGLHTGAVGLITNAKQADDIVRSGQADMVLLARGMLRDPYWPLHAAQALGQKAPVPVQYERAFL